MDTRICIVDTDILIDVSRGNDRAIEFLDGFGDFWSMSAVTSLELIVGAKTQREVAQIDQLIANYQTVPVTRRTGDLAYVLLKRYARSYGLRTFDSLIAATAIEEGGRLATRNRKHFGMIGELTLNVPLY